MEIWHINCLILRVGCETDKKLADSSAKAPLRVRFAFCNAVPGLTSCALMALVFTGFTVSAAELTLAAIADAGQRRDLDVQEVRSVRKYILHNPKWEEDAIADVLVTMSGNGQEKYTILSSTAKGFHKEILRRILDGEMEAAEKKAAEIVPANYEAKSAGTRSVDGKPCQAFELVPKKRSKYVLDGWMCADAQDKAMVHVEGETAKSVSFWIGKVYISRDFHKIGQYWYSAVSHSRAEVRFLGKTELTVQFLDYQITPKNGPVFTACRKTGCSPALKNPSSPQLASDSADAATIAKNAGGE